jgi:peptidoglycan/LPS O-acetylase OafA/YrhL
LTGRSGLFRDRWISDHAVYRKPARRAAPTHPHGRRIRRILPPLYIYLVLIAPYIFLRYPVHIKGWIASLTFTTNFYQLLPSYLHSGCSPIPGRWASRSSFISFSRS